MALSIIGVQNFVYVDLLAKYRHVWSVCRCHPRVLAAGRSTQQRRLTAFPGFHPARDVETRASLKACIEARVALAELNMAARSIPNQAILMNTLPALEACASSKIDHFSTTIDQLFQYAGDDGEPTDPGTRAAFRYRTALQRGVDSLKERPLSTATAVEVCREICGFELDIRTQPAAAFTNQAGVTLYTPPCGEALVRELLANWERYLHDEPASTRSFGWPSDTISSRPFIHSATATDPRGAS